MVRARLEPRIVADRSDALAKLTRPKLHGALPRLRLFALLDEAVAARPIVWVSAPPGAGKSTLVAGWLEARGQRHLWYQMDEGDAVPATFAHYLRLAVQPFVRRRKRAPGLFPPQPQQPAASFARAFFRDLFALLPAGCVLVLDNFQEVPGSAEQRAALALGLDEVPEGRSVVIVSRAEPPPEFARLLAAQRIARLDAAALRCTDAEAEAILAAGGASAAQVERIRPAAGGWLAALVLWREHLRDGGAAGDAEEAALGAGRDAVFAYFAGEILARLAPAQRHWLACCAHAPSLTLEDAQALAGDERAAALLESLYRRRLFVERRHGVPATYQWHALFREFLLGQAQRRLPADQRRTLAAQAARRLAGRGALQDALVLARDAQDWPTLRTLVEANARAWAREGRAQALSDWIDALPAELRDADPWLAYWQGRAWIFLQPARGRPALERALEGFRQAGDRRGQALALATLVTGSYYEWADFRPLDRWRPELEALLADGAPALDRESELRARAAQLIALLFRRPDADALARCAARLDALVDGEADPNVRVMAASILFNHCNWMRDAGDADALVARTEPVLAGGAVGPLMQLWWRTHLSFWHYLNARYERSSAVADEARAIAERYGLQAYLFEIDHARAEALISADELEAARTLVDAMEQRLAPARRMDATYFHNLRSTLRQRLGQAGAALDDARRAVQLADETGLPALQRPTFLARLAQAQAGTGDLDSALATLDESVASAATPADVRHFERMRTLLEVERHLQRGAPDAAAAQLAPVLADGRARRLATLVRSRPEAAARLAAFALERGIEPDYVAGLVARNRLAAPPGTGPAWPYRLRLHALGGFRIVRDGQPMRFAGKAQQRPLDLLKLLVALGGREVDAHALTDALWPEAAGDAAKTSFDSTLFRLRKLLDVDDALRLAGGKLSLDATQVWTDVAWLHARLEAAGGAGDAAAAQRAAAALLEAWPGPLLGDESPAWVLRPRDALHARVVGTLVRLGGLLEHGAAPAAAAALYRRALEIDNLAEALHRALMRALATAGDHAEALAAYRRCRELLARVLGSAPSAETEALHERVLAAALAPRR